MVKKLLKSGVPPTLTNDFQESALHLAAGEGHLQVVELLLRSKLDINLQGIAEVI